MSKKRKGDAHQHETREEFQRAAEEEAANVAHTSAVGTPAAQQQPPAEGSFAKADPATIDNRRIVSASSSSGAPIGSSSSDGTTRAAKRRRIKYLAELSELNEEFARWARELEKQLHDRLSANGGVSSDADGPGLFYIDAAEEYLEAAAALKSKYARDYGAVLTMGTGDCGQLGNDENVLSSRRPRMLAGLRSMGIDLVSCGGLHNIALARDGEVYAWGSNDEGALGTDEIETAYVPVVVKGFIAEDGTNEDGAMVYAATGDVQSLLLSTSGKVYMFGGYKDKEGKVWRDDKPSSDLRIDPKVTEEAPRGKQTFPIHVSSLKGKVRMISCGFSYNVAVMEEDESLMTWGIGESGELARPVPPMKDSKDNYQLDAIRVNYLKPQPPIWAGPSLSVRKVVSVGCGGYHLLVAVRENSGPSSQVLSLSVYSSGLNNYGQLGHGDLVGRSELTKIEALEGEKIKKVEGGTHHSLALDYTGQNLFGWGRCDSGQVGIYDTLPDAGDSELSPRPILLDKNISPNPCITQIAAGGNHNLVLTEEGHVYSWGYGDLGALGHGEEKDELRPRKVDVLAGVRKREKKPTAEGKVRQVAGGGQHSVLVVTRTDL